MECFERLNWTDYSKQELFRLSIGTPKEEIRKQIMHNWDNLAKPLDGMGRFESLLARIGAVWGSPVIDLGKKAVVIFCADNGIVEEGVSQSGQEVTAAIVGMMGRGASSVCYMAKSIGADVLPIDLGVKAAEQFQGVLCRKIRYGTRNFSREPAMTEQETVQAIAVGIEQVARCKEQGYRILAAGEAGIGNTTTSSAIAAALLHCEASCVTGKGAGLSDEGLARKQEVIASAIRKYDLYRSDAFTVLQTVGGLDIAGLTGLCIGGAIYGMPIVLDGVISMAAALLAERMFPGARAFFLPSHKGKEPAIAMIAGELELEPVIDGSLALGEGTGAVMMLALLEVALSVYQGGTTFEDIQIEKYTRK